MRYLAALREAWKGKQIAGKQGPSGHVMGIPVASGRFPGKSFPRPLFVEKIAHGFEELHDGDRFRQIGLASALPDFFLVAFHGESGM